MIETTTTQPDSPPLQRHQQIETDTFCAYCGYNLHAQPVTRDPNLGIFICRCPECGKFHPAGQATAASSLWLARLATLALMIWVLFVLFAAFLLCLGLGGVQVTHAEEFSSIRSMSADGREVEWTNVPGTGTMLVFKGTTQPAGNLGIRRVRTADWPNADTPRQVQSQREQLLFGAMVLGLSDLGLGLVAGMLIVTFFWHWKRQRYRLVLFLPFAVAACVLAVMLREEEYELIRGWTASRVLMHAALQAIFMYVGIRIGRPVARGLLRMFIPPRPRQLFAFLWRVDGKTVPPASPTTTM